MAFDTEGSALAAVQARRAIRELAGLKIDVPKPVTDKLDQLDVLTAAAPKAPSNDELIQATVAGDQPRIAAAAAELVSFDVRRQAHAQAVQRAGQTVLDALRANRRPVIKALTAQAEQAAEKIAAARQLGNVTVESLVLQHRHDDASTLASVGAHRQVFHRLTEWAHRHLGEFLDVADPDAAPAA